MRAEQSGRDAERWKPTGGLISLAEHVLRCWATWLRFCVVVLLVLAAVVLTLYLVPLEVSVGPIQLRRP
ncbi:hypothetical protein GCM10012275_46690 [Longimycelium tulufanense]|uniref:Uncharacterized protein n=2 Tax=Longimycelium tulufanense TaxID=907463 RepID=A0A8J3CBR2_9PSEU|nr:hypothetical protein GCM10012275_46690 [Longimycelium tulufanense]